jgi:transposase InsO family protein
MVDKVVPMEIRLLVGLMSGKKINVSAFCRDYDISRQHFYRLRDRAVAEGLAAVSVPRSRRPRSSPGQTPADVEDAVVRWRKTLAEDGLDNGAVTIGYHLRRESGHAPATSTINAILVRRGLVVAAPQKRPKSATKRFVFPRPNDCWQIDGTWWRLRDGGKAIILQVLDDHSRKIVASLAAPGEDAVSAWAVLVKAFDSHGLPAMLLSDNALAFNGSRRQRVVDVERNLRALGVRPVASRPYHPQTCGKNERSHQTLHRWLRAHPAAADLAELQLLLDDYDAVYNDRPHQALAMATPRATWAATAPADPPKGALAAPTSVRTLLVSAAGAINVTPTTRLGLGRGNAGRTVTVISTGQDVAVFLGSELLRRTTLTPDRIYIGMNDNP